MNVLFNPDNHFGDGDVFFDDFKAKKSAASDLILASLPWPLSHYFILPLRLRIIKHVSQHVLQYLLPCPLLLRLHCLSWILHVPWKKLRWRVALPRLHRHQSPHPPSVLPCPLDGFLSTETWGLCCIRNNKPLWFHHLQLGHHGDYLCFGIPLLLFCQLRVSSLDDDHWVLSFRRHFPCTDSLSLPDLCGALHGCCSPHRLPETGKVGQGEGQKHQPCVCLAVEHGSVWCHLTLLPSVPRCYIFFPQRNHHNYSVFLQHFCSESLLERGWASRADRPNQAEGLPKHSLHNRNPGDEVVRTRCYLHNFRLTVREWKQSMCGAHLWKLALSS